MATILVVDDEKNYLWMLEELFQSEGYEVLTSERAEDALPLLTEGRVDLLLTDLRMAEMDGMGLLGRVREMSPASSTIIMTAFGTVERAVEAMRLGAYDFILKPFNQADLLRAVAKALERTVLLRENLRLSQTLSHHYRFDQLIGKSSLMQEVFEKIKRVAGSKSPVLITGESGSGKELVARAIHFNGPRCGRPVLPVNCSVWTRSPNSRWLCRRSFYACWIPRRSAGWAARKWCPWMSVSWLRPTVISKPKCRPDDSGRRCSFASTSCESM